MDVIKKSTHISIKLPFKLNELLERFQSSYFLETGKRMTKQEVIHRALETYITKAYELSKEK